MSLFCWFLTVKVVDGFLSAIPVVRGMGGMPAMRAVSNRARCILIEIMFLASITVFFPVYDSV